MPWPLSQDYNEAIQNPTPCFADAELRQAEAKCNAIGLPTDKILAMLSEHMENVIQKYLRSQFASIEDYNDHAGEVDTVTLAFEGVGVRPWALGVGLQGYSEVG